MGTAFLFLVGVKTSSQFLAVVHELWQEQRAGQLLMSHILYAVVRQPLGKHVAVWGMMLCEHFQIVVGSHDDLQQVGAGVKQKQRNRQVQHLALDKRTPR